MAILRDELEKNLQDSNATPMFLPLDFLKAITRDFSTELELGRGGYGVVYKGVLRSGKIIAVKKLFEIHLLDDKTFRNEVTYLMEIKHRNVIRFIGYCAESSWETIKKPDGTFIWAEIPKRLLCFEYLCNKSLDKYISDKSSDLEWNMRYEIIKGICSGLKFLHEECGLVHLDIKPENILMDYTMKPKIADFGLSRMFGNQQSRIVTDNCVGSRGYMAPEYINQGIISKKADIFSLGVIIIEIITGCRDYPYFQLDSPESIITTCQHYTEKVLESWRKIFDSTPKHISLEKHALQVKHCVAIALKCVDPCMEKRPTAKDIMQGFHALDQVIPGPKVLLDNGPLELRFRCEPNKSNPWPLHLQNNTYNHVAFQLTEKSNNQTDFICMVAHGIVAPMSTYTLVMNTNRDENLPEEENVYFVLQNTIVDPTNIQPFEEAKMLGNKVHKLKVIWDPQGETTFEAIQPFIKIIDDATRIHGLMTSMDANQIEPLIIIGYSSGVVKIWNYDTKKWIGLIKLSKTSVCSIKFIARKQWFVAISRDCFVHVYKYDKKMQAITRFMVHNDRNALCPVVAFHPSQPYVLSGCHTQIKLWDWDLGWKCIQTFEEPTNDVSLAITFNPEDANSFASASRDYIAKVWRLDSPESQYGMCGHSEVVRSLDFFTHDGQQYLVTGSDDRTAKIWAMRKKECVRTLTHSSKVYCVVSHSDLRVLVTGTSDGYIYLWSSTNFRLKRIIDIHNGGYVTGLACLMGSRSIVVAQMDRLSMIDIRDEKEQSGSKDNEDNSPDY